MTRIGLACIAAAALAAIPARAQPLPGDPAAGHRIATAICALCHQVEAGQPPKPGGPASFDAVANLTSTTALSLTVFLRSSHRNMPNLILTPEESGDIVAYILSLRRR